MQHPVVSTDPFNTSPSENIAPSPEGKKGGFNNTSRQRENNGTSFHPLGDSLPVGVGVGLCGAIPRDTVSSQESQSCAVWRMKNQKKKKRPQLRPGCCSATCFTLVLRCLSH